jgi:hypothetical protein
VSPYSSGIVLAVNLTPCPPLHFVPQGCTIERGNQWATSGS